MRERHAGGSERTRAAMRSWPSSRRAVVVIAAALTIPAGTASYATPTVSVQTAWTRQMGSTTFDEGWNVAADASGAFVVGEVGGPIPGQDHLGGLDAFVRRYSQGGRIQWTRQFGTAQSDSATGVALHGSAVYVAGSTSGQLGDTVSDGFHDAFVRRYSSDGAVVWTRQFGSDNDDRAQSVSVSAAGVYVGGRTSGTILGQESAGTQDAFVRLYGHDGSVKWTHQFGTGDQDAVIGLAATPSGVYVAGSVGGSLMGQTHLGGVDAFLRRYDDQGNIEWTRQFGTAAADMAVSVSVGSSGLYVGGWTEGALPGQTHAGLSDTFLRRYSTGGAVSWTRQVGGTGYDYLTDVAASPTGVYASGSTPTTIYGQSSNGGIDAFISRHSATGALVWARQFGTTSGEAARAITGSVAGVYVVGSTQGTFSGQTPSGSMDAFTARFVSYRPDAMISKVASSGYAGDDIYNNTANNQARSADVARGDKQSFDVRAENDGDAIDTFTVDGCASNDSFNVIYLRGSDDVTGAVTDGSYRLKDIGPGAAVTLRAVVKVAGDASSGASKTCAVTIESTRKPALSDTVKAVVEAHG
jgi:hypothetical protein